MCGHLLSLAIILFPPFPVSCMSLRQARNLVASRHPMNIRSSLPHQIQFVAADALATSASPRVGGRPVTNRSNRASSGLSRADPPARGQHCLSVADGPDKIKLHSERAAI